MDAAPPDFRLLQFSSDQLPPPDRFELWRDIVTRKLLRMAIDPLTDGAFIANASLRSQHGVSIGQGVTGPTANHRTREIVASDNDDFVLMANLDGPFVVRWDGEDLSLGAGEAMLISCAQTGNFIRPSAGRIMCVRLPRSALSVFVTDPESSTGRRIPADSGPLQMLMAYASPLAGNSGLTFTPEASRSVISHVCDLVALAVGATGEAAQLAASRGLRAARLRAVKTCINERIGPTDLSVEDVACEIGVSPRYVRKLLESEGISFSRYVVERRLERARERLISPRHTGQSISTIAFDVGFGDLSYFNRAFRRRFERTPSDIRAGHI